DFLPQAPGFDAVAGTKTAPAVPKFRIMFYNPRLVVGGPHDTEFGVNFPTFHTTASVPNASCSAATPTQTCAYIEPNFKWKFYKNDDEGLSFVTGAILHTPL